MKKINKKKLIKDVSLNAVHAALFSLMDDINEGNYDEIIYESYDDFKSPEDKEMDGKILNDVSSLMRKNIKLYIKNQLYKGSK